MSVKLSEDKQLVHEMQKFSWFNLMTLLAGTALGAIYTENAIHR